MYISSVEGNQANKTIQYPTLERVYFPLKERGYSNEILPIFSECFKHFNKCVCENMCTLTELFSSAFSIENIYHLHNKIKNFLTHFDVPNMFISHVHATS